MTARPSALPQLPPIASADKAGPPMTDVFDRYPEFRDKPKQMAMLCAVLNDRGLHDDAFAVGRAAIAAAPGDGEVRNAVCGILAGTVAQFHVPMLRDAARNAAYRRAIERVVRPGMRVLEIGTGAGLLAMIAARAGATVVTCEENQTIAAAAADIIARNGLSDRITLIRKRSTALTIPEDLPEPADLVIHEIFGRTVFDEGVTAALSDARRRLLKPAALAVPPGARVRCMLVRAPKLPPPATLDQVEGFDLSGFELLARRSVSLTAAQYERLELASGPVSALSMNYDRMPPFGPASETVTVQSLGGRIDGMLQWLALDFAGGETLENNPFDTGVASSWGALYTPLAEPLATEPGEPLRITLRHRGTSLVSGVTRHPPG